MKPIVTVVRKNGTEYLAEYPELTDPNAGVYAALIACAEYLECIPESKAGGDDEAGRLAKAARAALAKARGEV